MQKLKLLSLFQLEDVGYQDLLLFWPQELFVQTTQNCPIRNKKVESRISSVQHLPSAFEKAKKTQSIINLNFNKFWTNYKSSQSLENKKYAYSKYRYIISVKLLLQFYLQLPVTIATVTQEPTAETKGFVDKK